MAGHINGKYFTPPPVGNDEKITKVNNINDERSIQTDSKTDRISFIIGASDETDTGNSDEFGERDSLSIGENDTNSTAMDYQQNYSSSILNSTAIDIGADSNTTYNISERCCPIRPERQEHEHSPAISDIIADLSKVKDEILSMSQSKSEIVVTKDIGTSTDISDLPTDDDDESDEEKLLQHLDNTDTEKIDSDMIQLLDTDDDKTFETNDGKLTFLSKSVETETLSKIYEPNNLTTDDVDSMNSKITESNFKMDNESSRSVPFTLQNSDGSTYNINGNHSYSDGYFNASLDKLYKDRQDLTYDGGEEYGGEEYGEEEYDEEEKDGHEDIGCFDRRKDDDGKGFLFSR